MKQASDIQWALKEKPKQRILFWQGFWWYQHPGRKLATRLEPLFEKCRWRVDGLCKELGIGKRTFARVVEESIGITGKAWLCQLRAVSACHLLREEGKIEPLAHRLGFADISNFTREFKKQVGVSPSFYKQAELSRSRMCGLND